MKHSAKITILLLSMFIFTQIIGLVVIHADPLKIKVQVNGTIQEIPNPYLPSPQEVNTQGNYWQLLYQQILPAFIIAVLLLFFLMKFRIETFLRLWFFMVVGIAIFITFIAFLKLIPIKIELPNALGIALAFAIPLAFTKVYLRNLLVHNFTEFLIYPGIASVFIPILNIYTIIVLLIFISIYDMWAVWKAKFMQKMAKYQIHQLKIFSGFFVPYLTDKMKAKLKKQNVKIAKTPSKSLKLKKQKLMKVNVAILGGGDIIFPIITSGIMLQTYGLIPAILTIIGATVGLSYLFFFAEKKKFYPAMPFITAGMFIAIILTWIIF